MLNRRLHWSLASLAALAAAVLLTLLVVPAATSAEGDSSPAAQAVTTLTVGTAAQALAAVPEDFPAVMGYAPVLEDGEVVRTDGDCSSPVPLPARFEPVCRQHDYGYDLLRYADRTGAPLGAWARVALDESFRGRLTQTCPARDSACHSAAVVAASAVELNTVRQGSGVPEESSATRAALAVSVLGAVGLTPVLLPRRGRVATRRLLDRIPAPAVLPTVLVALAAVVSLTPSLLPRPIPTQGLLTGVLVALALGVAGLVRRRAGEAGRARPALRRAVLVLSVAGTAVAAALSAGLQAQTAATVGMAAPGATYWPGVAVVAVGTAYSLVLLGRVTRWLVRRRVPAALGVVGVAAAVSAAALPDGVGLLDFLDKDIGPDHVLLQESPVGAGRVYEQLADGAGPEVSAARAADRLVAGGGLEREAVVVVLPTGSGWVNRQAVEAFEDQWGADVVTLAVQYDRSPSWLSLLVAQGNSKEWAHATLAAVVDRIEALPEDERPALYVHGESLGALAGQSALSDPELADHVCGAIWSGAPGGTVLGLPGERVLANADDPVIHLSAGTATARPDDWGGALWVPALSYGTTVLDLAASLAPESGHGHQYGPEQDWTLPGCAS